MGAAKASTPAFHGCDGSVAATRPQVDQTQASSTLHSPGSYTLQCAMCSFPHPPSAEVKLLTSCCMAASGAPISFHGKKLSHHMPLCTPP
eukprot:1141823-Pelagomonas_calceolata.AAC.1